MADKGIIFSAPMVRALLDGRKTQTRRLCDWANNPLGPALSYIVAGDEPGWFGDEEGEVQFKAGYAPGDRLYVRESYYQFGHWKPLDGAVTKGGKQKWAFVPTAGVPAFFIPPHTFRLGRHHKDAATPAWHKRLGRFMPRDLSRMWLVVSDVRVQRLQEISVADAIAEGVDDAAVAHFKCPVKAYAALWNHLHGAENEQSWEANPWIVAVSFDVNHGNIDAGSAQ